MMVLTHIVLPLLIGLALGVCAAKLLANRKRKMDYENSKFRRFQRRVNAFDPDAVQHVGKLMIPEALAFLCDRYGEPHPTDDETIEHLSERLDAALSRWLGRNHVS